MFACIAGSGPLIYEWIDAQEIHIFLIYLAPHSIFHEPNIMNYKLNVIIIIQKNIGNIK